MKNSLLAACGNFSRVASILVVLLIGSPALAQLPTGTVSGVVRDPSGAVIPGANVTIRNTQTGLSRAIQSGGNGSYRFPALPGGSYEIRVAQSGFQTQVRSGLTLAVGQEAVVNFTLTVGAVEQTVAVTAEAPLVNTTSGSLGTLVDEQKIADLPLDGRNYIDLTLLQPGITQHRGNGQGGGETPGIMLSSNGAPLRSNNFLLDGAPIVGFHGQSSASATGSTLGLEGIREWQVITNSFSAEYGMTMGSQMTMVSKGGTNSFHGSLFEYMRNSALDARNFFDYKTDLSPRRLPAFTRNNFGASFGGPIRQDRTFFFADYEGLRERVGATSIQDTLPVSAKVDGGLVPEISPVTRPLLALYPDPNLPDDKFTEPFNIPGTDNHGQARVDQTLSDSDTGFVRYTINDAQQTRINTPGWNNNVISRTQYATLSETHVFTPALLLTSRFSFSRTKITLLPELGPSGPEFSFVAGESLGKLQVGGLDDVGPDSGAPKFFKQNIFTWSGDVFYTRGRHVLKFGTLINRYQQYLDTRDSSRAEISFDDVETFLLAQPSQIEALSPGSITDRTYHSTTFGFYLQDDLRVRSNFTLNLGLRYEFSTVPRDIHGIESTLRDIRNDTEGTVGPTFRNPSLRNFSPRFGFAWDVKGDGRTAVRGGFGLLYDIGNIGAVLESGAVTLPFSNTSTLQTPPPIALVLPISFEGAAQGNSPTVIDYNFQQPHMLQYNLTVERELPFNMVTTLAYGGSRGLNLVQRVDGNHTLPQLLPDGRNFWTGSDPRWNPAWDVVRTMTSGGNSWYNSLQFGLMKRLSNGIQFQSSYTWSKLLDDGQGQLSSDRTGYTADSINRHLDKGPAGFDVAHNWRFNTIYRLPEMTSGGTLAKVVNGWWTSGILSLQTGYPVDVRMSADRARTKQGSISANRPDLVPGRNHDNITKGTSTGCPGVAAGTPIGVPELYYDPCAFSVPAAGFLGTAGRGTFRGPGFANLDLSVGKDTALGFLGESGKLEFRAEFFNSLNRVNFGNPGVGGGGGNNAANVFAGRASGERPLSAAAKPTNAATSRQIQFALKVIF